MTTEAKTVWDSKTEQLCMYCGNYAPQRMTEGAPARGECREKPPTIVTPGNDLGHFPLVWPDFLRICRTYPKSGMCDANLTEVLAIVMNEAGGVKNGFSFLSRVASRLEEKQTGGGSGRGGKTYVSRFK